jgi:deoxyribose-phosphate aldolase
MKLTAENLARMVDLSAVRTDVSLAEVRELAATASRYQCICAFALPCYVGELAALLAGAPDVHVGGTVGFPSGAHASAVKAAEARQLRADGADELDMVINVGLLISGRLAAVEEDVRAVVGAAEGTPVKVILECHYLNDDQIRNGAELAVRAGAAWVKTSTGWAPTGATAHNVALIRSAVGEAAGVKAAGGIRSLEALVELYRAGARRFGLGSASGVKILDQCAALPGGAVDV